MWESRGRISASERTQKGNGSPGKDAEPSREYMKTVLGTIPTHAIQGVWDVVARLDVERCRKAEKRNRVLLVEKNEASKNTKRKSTMGRTCAGLKSSNDLGISCQSASHAFAPVTF